MLLPCRCRNRMPECGLSDCERQQPKRRVGWVPKLNDRSAARSIRHFVCLCSGRIITAYQFWTEDAYYGL